MRTVPRGAMEPTVLLCASLLLAAATAPVRAMSYYFALDVPARLGGADYRPDQILRSDDAVYTVEFAAGDPSLQIGGLHRRPDGLWLVAVAVPQEGVAPRDVILFDGVEPVPFFVGATAGVPDYARIDAILLDGGGSLVLSFDVPVRLDGVEYGRSDLVRWNGVIGFSLYRDAEAAGIPAGSNLVGADLDSAGSLVVTFDVPTRLGSTGYLPGQLVRWDATGFTLYYSDDTWPISAQIRDFSFVPHAGAVPDGDAIPGTPLIVAHAAGSDITLSWGSGCAAGVDDYALYEGTLGNFYSHTQKFCTTGGATTKTFTPQSADSYYLVVPRNAVREGSYGHRSGGGERPQGTAACLPQETGACP